MVPDGIRHKVSTLLDMMLKTQKYNPNDLGGPGAANHVSLFSQELIEVVDIKKAIFDKQELPRKAEMERMNEYYRWCKLESAESEASKYAESLLPNSQGLIYVIKEVRQKFGLGLKESKDIVEAAQKRLDKV
jgi:ribosomal protein L7/L12